jgi:hypothetical protein
MALQHLARLAIAAGLAALLPFAAAAQSAASPDRVALVIGNSAYKTSPLANPVNDAADVAAALRGLGFQVVSRNNASQAEMRNAIRDFGNQLRRAQVGLFYYAGHGLQIAGNNYIVPVSADIRNEADAEDLSINMTYVLRTMEESQVKVSLVILDACRNNPYARGFRSASRGLAQMNAATGSLIAFATAPGAVAADGSGRNGIYTKHLLQSLRESDTDVLKVFQRTRAGVVAETGGAQTPWESTSLVGDFYFRGAAPARAKAAPASPVVASDSRADDRVFWESVKDSRNAGELQAYLDQFPNGLYAPLARSRLAAVPRLAAARPSEGPQRSVQEVVTRLNAILTGMANRPSNQKQSAAGLVYSEAYAADAEGLRYRTWRCAASLIKGCEPQYLEGGLIRFRDMKVELRTEERCNTGPGTLLFGKRCSNEQVLVVGGDGAFNEGGWDVIARGFDSSSTAIAQEMHELLKKNTR